LRFALPSNQTVAAAYYSYGPPDFRCVYRAALVYDPRVGGQVANGDPDRPRTNNWAWSQNASLIILDFMRHPDGWRKGAVGGNRAMTPIAAFDVPAWIAFANICDQPIVVNNSGGGTVPRYILSGCYDMGTTSPKEILDGLLRACDGEVFLNNGLISIRGGAFGAVDPDLPVFGEDDIIEYELHPGASVFSAVNWMNATFTWARNDYKPIQMDPLLDQANIDLRGEVLTDTLDLAWCPTYSQARRVSKIAMAKRNPQWQGTITLGPRGLLTEGQRLICLNIPELAIDASLAFWVTKIERSPGWETTKLTLQTLDPSAYDFDPSTEEGILPVVGSSVPEPSNPNLIPPPVSTLGFGVPIVATFTRATGTLTALWQNLAFITAFYDAAYCTDGLNFIPVPVPDLNGQSVMAVTITGLPSSLPAGQPEFRVRLVTPGGKASVWSETSATVI
jgi:hypothetical protein